MNLYREVAIVVCTCLSKDKNINLNMTNNNRKTVAEVASEAGILPLISTLQQKSRDSFINFLKGSISEKKVPIKIENHPLPSNISVRQISNKKSVSLLKSDKKEQVLSSSKPIQDLSPRGEDVSTRRSQDMPRTVVPVRSVSPPPTREIAKNANHQQNQISEPLSRRSTQSNRARPVSLQLHTAPPISVTVSGHWDDISREQSELILIRDYKENREECFLTRNSSLKDTYALSLLENRAITHLRVTPTLKGWQLQNDPQEYKTIEEICRSSPLVENKKWIKKI